MGSDVGQIFQTASLHRDHSIKYALVCEKELSQMGKNSGNSDLHILFKESPCDSHMFLKHISVCNQKMKTFQEERYFKTT